MAALGTDDQQAVPLLTIGQLAERSGVATTALRYYDDLGLVRPSARVSGQRRYTPAAVTEVAVIRFLSVIGFTLSEIASFVSDTDVSSTRLLIEAKLDEVAEIRHRLDIAEQALEHARACPAGNPLRCDRFNAIIAGQLDGLTLADSHHLAHAHATSRPQPPIHTTRTQ